MNLLHLHYFYVVAQQGSFTKASELLRIQQPAISRMVKQLEGSLGSALFERMGRTIRLTTEGAEVFRYSQSIFAEVERLKHHVAKEALLPRGPLAFAASEPIASHFVPSVLERLRRDAPDLYPQIYSGPASILFERILKGDLEFGLFFHVPTLPARLKLTVLKKIRFYLVVRRDLVKDRQVLGSFIGSREIDDLSTRTFPTLAKLRKLEPKASIRISSNNLTAHRELVRKGLGVAVLPDFLVEEDLKKRVFADVLPKERLEFDLKLVERTTAIPSLNARVFLENCSLA